MFIVSTLSQLDEAVRAGAGEILVLGTAVAILNDHGGSGGSPLVDALLLNFQRVDPSAADAGVCLLVQKDSRH